MNLPAIYGLCSLPPATLAADLLAFLRSRTEQDNNDRRQELEARIHKLEKRLRTHSRASASRLDKYHRIVSKAGPMRLSSEATTRAEALEAQLGLSPRPEPIFRRHVSTRFRVEPALDDLRHAQFGETAVLPIGQRTFLRTCGFALMQEDV
jgi:hypothetical protein